VQQGRHCDRADDLADGVTRRQQRDGAGELQRTARGERQGADADEGAAEQDGAE